MFEIGSDQWPGISKLVEECGEVLQICGKLMGTKGEVTHWDMNRTSAPNSTENLKERLTMEMGDLFAALRFVGKHCGIDERAVEQRMNRKLARFEEWHQQQSMLITPCTKAPSR
jgi:NTP pyrophosphatase (non-canonical NTP hydrolase)